MMAGAAAFPYVVAARLAPAARGSAPFVEGIAARAGMWAGAVLVALQLPRMALQARAFIDTGDALWPMIVNVMGTLWGRAWFVQTLSAAVATAGFVSIRRSASRRGLRPRQFANAQLGGRLALTGAVMVLACAPFMGHPAAASHGAWIDVAVDLTHISAVTTWVGVLSVMFLVSRAPELHSEGGSTLAAMIAAFHPVALRGAPLAVVSGAAGAFLRLPRIDALWLSPYGRLLLVKTCLVMFVLALGALNSRTAMRRADGGRVRSVHGSLAAEVLLAVLTLVVTANLVATEPPG